MKTRKILPRNCSPAQSILLFNRQRRFHIDTKPLSSFLERLTARLGIRQNFSLVLISDRAMRRFHRVFAGKDRATDVLSFPNETEPWETAISEPYLGDILICVDSANAQKRGDLLEELKRLSLHGLLHLLGYDHEADTGEMKALEESLRKEFELP